MSETDRIPTNLRALMILEALGQGSDPMSPSDIGRVIGLPKQTVHRLCNTLIQEGFLVRDERQRGLRPGRRARHLGNGIMQASVVHTARTQILQALSDLTGETVNYVVPETKGMAYQDRVETDWPIRIQLPIGTSVPFFCTASGKVYLASLPKKERTRLVNVMRLEPYTKNTITDPERLLEELQQVAKRGFSLDNGEFFDSMNAIAVPVVDGLERYCASLAVHAPALRMSLTKAVEYKDALFAASEKLTKTVF